MVVGVDGSPVSAEATHWVARYADAFGGALRLVSAWHYPSTYGTPVVTDTDFAAEADRELAQMELQVRQQFPNLSVQRSPAQGHPARVLLDAAADADLLVVGGRGHGTFTGALLGSVSNYCVHHASCPVVVIRNGGHPAPAAT